MLALFFSFCFQKEDRPDSMIVDLLGASLAKVVVVA